MAAATAFLSFLALSPVTLLMPFYFELVLRLPADQAGLLLVAIPATVACIAPFSGALSDYLGPRLIASAGLLVETLGLALLIFLPATGGALAAAARLVIVGAGQALFQSPNSSALFGSVPRSRLGLVGGFQALTRNLGQSLGQVLAGTLWTMVVMAAAGNAAHVAVEAPPAAMMAGFRAVFTVSTALAAAAVVVSLARPPAPARAGRTHDGSPPVAAE